MLHDVTHFITETMDVPDLSSSISGIQPFFGNPVKSSSGQNSSWIWWLPMQLQYVQLITDKTNAADLSCGHVVYLQLQSVLLGR